MGKLFHIVIPIKQVPETSNVRMDEKSGTMIREGVQSIVNPLDLYSIEAGLQLKEEVGGKITVITMGPRSAETSLREAISMGCDEGVLITGSEFAGSDTWATSYVLSLAIRKIGSFDLILTGERATDGETGHVGPGIASFLDLPLSTYASRIVEISDSHIIVERLVEEGYETLKLTLPALLTVTKEMCYPRLPTLRGKQRGKNTEISVWTGETLGVNDEDVGLKGSPTRVVKLSSPKITRRGTVLETADEEGVEHAVAELIHFMEKKIIIP